MSQEVSVIEIVDDVDPNGTVNSRLAPISSQGTTKSTAISVEQYVPRRVHYYGSIIASPIRTTSGTFIDLSYKDDDGDDNEVRVLHSAPAETQWRRRRRPYGRCFSVTEPGQSSNSKSDRPFNCEICVEPKTEADSFRIKGCSHAYCVDCVSRYVASKLQDNVSRIGCPVSACGGVLEPYYCRSILPPEVFDRWGSALCEALFVESKRFYCPFRDCSGLMIDDGGVEVRESECPHCRRLFCARCKVPWHDGIQCEEFQKLSEGEREREDIMLVRLAEEQQWRRCPKCGFYVQKVQGCKFVRCRCGVEFCYTCGTQSQTSHYCPKCRC